MHLLDYLIFGAYMLAVLGVGVYFFKKNETNEDYYVGGRSISAFHVGLSIAATDVGGGFSIGREMFFGLAPFLPYTLSLFSSSAILVREDIPLVGDVERSEEAEKLRSEEKRSALETSCFFSSLLFFSSQLLSFSASIFSIGGESRFPGIFEFILPVCYTLKGQRS